MFQGTPHPREKTPQSTRLKRDSRPHDHQPPRDRVLSPVHTVLSPLPTTAYSSSRAVTTTPSTVHTTLHRVFHVPQTNPRSFDHHPCLCHEHPILAILCSHLLRHPRHPKIPVQQAIPSSTKPTVVVVQQETPRRHHPIRHSQRTTSHLQPTSQATQVPS